MPTFKLQAIDGEIFAADTESVKCSTLFLNMLEAVPVVDESFVLPINVYANILRLVLEWANYHRNDDDEAISVDTTWDDDFIDLQPGM